MKTLSKSFTILFMILLTVSCAKEEVILPVEDELSDQSALKKAKVLDVEDLILNGETHFPSYAVKEHKVIAPWDENFLNCEATLNIEGNQMTLVTEESFPGFGVIRMVTFNGHISSGGVVKFSWPDTWIEFDFELWDYIEKTIDVLDDQIKEHTGCTVYGPGKGKGVFRLDYKGTFDGENFYAEAHFMGKQLDAFGNGMAPWYTKDYIEALLGREGYIDGPVQFKFTIELPPIVE